MKQERAVFGFKAGYWAALLMELFERWAFYGIFALIAIYMESPQSKGGLGFSSEDRGAIQGVVTFLIYFLPVLTGSIADRFGFRRVLLVAFVILGVGYYSMGMVSEYSALFAVFAMVGVGAALFKPVIVGTVSLNTTSSNDTVGFGIFYMVVNIGGFVGPFVASKMRDVNWDYVFLTSAAVIGINLILLFTLYKGNRNAVKIKREKFSKELTLVFVNMYKALLNFRFLLFVIIMSGFWMMYWQIFFTLPVYIAQWIDTTTIYNSAKWIAYTFGNNEGGINPEMLQNLGAATIVLFQVVVSNLIKRVRPLTSILFGILLSSLAMVVMSFGVNGWIIIIAIVFFTFGEMVSSPRTQEFVGRIAPKEMIGVYMGYSFLPVAFGSLAGGFLSGRLTARISDLYSRAMDELIKRGYTDTHTILRMDKEEQLSITMERLGMDRTELIHYLYETYQPYTIWWYFGAIGLLTVLGFLLYNTFVMPSKEKNKA